ncbi:MAG: hypothetical protein VR64_02570 [Desulfatitalea sp. BRH_c12]|nr:MAG: hypothetical protein VR64_02570 [Desulfatitalea sp. BRH_c12]
MKIRRCLTIVSVAGAVLPLVLGTVWFIFRGSDTDGTYPAANRQQPTFDIQEAKNPDLSPDQQDKLLVERLVNELRQRYGPTISWIGTQADLLDVQKRIMAMFPGQDGRAKFRRILRLAFPEHADQVIATLDKLEQYQRWLADSEGLLARMTSFERKAALWEKQRELFGDDAEDIWAGELLASEARTSAMQDVIADLGASRGTSIEEKIDAFQDALQQTYENSADAYLLKERFMLAKVFFSLDSVQEELKAMPTEYRSLKMDQIRREMGFSEDEIANIQLLDAERDRRWETGLKYKQERDQVISTYEGVEQESRLDALRKNYFQDEAETIAREEQEGFMRFNRPRIYGRN